MSLCSWHPQIPLAFLFTIPKWLFELVCSSMCISYLQVRVNQWIGQSQLRFWPHIGKIPHPPPGQKWSSEFHSCELCTCKKWMELVWIELNVLVGAMTLNILPSLTLTTKLRLLTLCKTKSFEEETTIGSSSFSVFGICFNVERRPFWPRTLYVIHALPSSSLFQERTCYWF